MFVLDSPPKISLLISLWYSVGKLKYVPPNIYHFCFPIITSIMFPNKLYLYLAGVKDRYVCISVLTLFRMAGGGEAKKPPTLPVFPL